MLWTRFLIIAEIISIVSLEFPSGRNLRALAPALWLRYNNSAERLPLHKGAPRNPHAECILIAESQVQGADMDERDVMAELVSLHSTLQERLALSQMIPEHIDPEKKWAGMKKIEDFFTRDLEAHFSAEEEIVFPIVRASTAAPELDGVIDELIGEHAEIRLRVGQMRQFMDEQIFPLQEPARLRINEMIEYLSARLAGHAAREDARVYPAYRTHTNTSAEDVHDDIC